jgi:hypothetical protein
MCAVHDYNLLSEEGLGDALERFVGTGNFDAVRLIFQQPHTSPKWLNTVQELVRAATNGLFHAAETGDLNQTMSILHKWTVESPDLPRPSAKNLEAALELAARNGYAEIVKVLLGNGAEITPMVTRSLRILKSSDIEANEAILQMFLEHGWDVNMMTDTGCSVLW